MLLWNSFVLHREEERQEESLIQESSSSISLTGNRFTRAERVILGLHQREQMSVEEIAMSLGLSLSRVSQMLNRLECEI